METTFDYLRAHATELGARILETYPPLQGPKDPIAPELATLLRKPLPAQALAVTGTAKHLRTAKAARIVAECGAGKTLMALATIHVLAFGRPSANLVMCPSHITHKWAREILLTIPRARAFLIEDLRNGGDPARPHGICEVKLSKGRTVYEGIRVVRLQNIGVGEFLDEDKAFISEEHFATLQKHGCMPGDVLIGTMGDPNLRACIQPANIPIALNKADCIQARPDPKHLKAPYLQCLLNLPSTLHLVPGMVHGQTRARVSMGELADLPIPVPPLPLQQQFASLVEKVERLRAVQREALRQAEHLFASLLHREFND